MQKTLYKIIASALFCSLFILGNAQITEDTQVSLLTCSPGHEIYSSFGHSAIRFIDTSTGIDQVFNYGTFNFNTPNFYLKFVRGKLMYRLSINNTAGFLSVYHYEERSVYEQILDLTVEEKKALHLRLMDNYKEENRYYQYDFFFDNCSSRIRDIFEEVLGNGLVFQYDDLKKTKTFRQLIDPYIKPLAWLDFGIDIMLGVPTDKRAEERDYMFLPDYLMYYFGKAELNGKPFVKSTETLLKLYKEPTMPPIWQRPAFAMWLLFIAVAIFTFLAIKKGKRLLGFDIPLMFILGTMGLLFAFMWTTDHDAAHANMNMLWAVPLLFIFFPLLKKFIGKKAILFFLVFVAISFLGFLFLPQKFHIAVLPILGILVVRYGSMFLTHKSKES